MISFCTFLGIQKLVRAEASKLIIKDLSRLTETFRP
jgi:hypothetical protein